MYKNHETVKSHSSFLFRGQSPRQIWYHVGWEYAPTPICTNMHLRERSAREVEASSAPSSPRPPTARRSTGRWTTTPWKLDSRQIWYFLSYNEIFHILRWNISDFSMKYFRFLNEIFQIKDICFLPGSRPSLQAPLASPPTWWQVPITHWGWFCGRFW